ncbi:Hypothetical predicted protein [Olea europaea subsp. europaea]|uniref:Uncharacterized protein n=1 Tax=Olea europaea subsp. europaea TaxID=158383 RepID=A0A8S0PBV9_OLEEU|nr:Hypothetical predicted protein [Olea europaea subsp. europaea]
MDSIFQTRENECIISTVDSSYSLVLTFAVLCSMICLLSRVKSTSSMPPYSSEDAHGLLKAAIRDPDAVVSGKRIACISLSFLSYIEREGKDVTIAAF